MSEPGLRKLDSDLPRQNMYSPEFLARQKQRLRERMSPASLADIERAKHAALDEVRAQAASIVADARAQADDIMTAALADAHRQIQAMTADAAKALRPQRRENPAPDFIKSPRRLVADIIREVAQRHGMTPAAITGQGRSKVIVAARFEAIALTYIERPDLSLPGMGRMFGGRDHTTILHALRRMGVYQEVGAGRRR
jgi:chromosomal replication initiation ATPase DnaA